MFAQRPSFRFLATGATISLFVLTFLVLASRSHNSGIRYTPKTSRPSTQSNCASLATSLQNQSWEFIVERDGDNHGLSEEQCQIAFPKLFGEIDKSASLRMDKPISFKELDSRNVEDGMVRGIIDHGEVNAELRMIFIFASHLTKFLCRALIAVHRRLCPNARHSIASPRYATLPPARPNRLSRPSSSSQHRVHLHNGRPCLRSNWQRAHMVLLQIRRA